MSQRSGLAAEDLQKLRWQILSRRFRKRIKRRRIRMLRTDQDGDIQVETDGQTLWVTTHPDEAHIPIWTPDYRRRAVRKPWRREYPVRHRKPR